MGSSYVEAMCDKFVEEDRMWKNFANELPTVSNMSIVNECRDIHVFGAERTLILPVSVH